MANDIKLQIRYTGYGIKENEKKYLFVEIGEREYHALKYLLSFAAEKHEYYSQIEDAVNLRQSLQDAWKTMLEYIDNEENE